MNGALRVATVSVTTTGSAGSATGSGTTSYPIIGEILGIYLNFHASAPATTDTTIATTNAPVFNILVVSNSATDAYKAPRSGAVDAANAAITNSNVPFVVADTITVSLAQCDALTGAVVATIWYREMN